MSISCKQGSLLISVQNSTILTNDGKQSLINTNWEQFSIKLLLYIEKYLYYHKNDGSASIFGMMKDERNLVFKFES